jgi:hypothetical protein
MPRLGPLTGFSPAIDLSETTRTVLRRAALLDTFDDQPDAAITFSLYRNRASAIRRVG